MADVGAAASSEFQRCMLERKPLEQKAQRCTAAKRTGKTEVTCWHKEDKDKWFFESIAYSGSYAYATEPQLEVVAGKVEDGLAAVKADPSKYDGLFYQTDMTEWPAEQQKYTLIKRTGSGFTVKEDGGPFTCFIATYRPLPTLEEVKKDAFTDELVRPDGGPLGEPVCPGRGSGYADVPGLSIIGHVGPSDVIQGQVGDCWLLSAISALAEFDGTIERLFRNTKPCVKSMPAAESNTYTISLWDLPTGRRVDVSIDERLCHQADNKALFGARASPDGELWACYLEKAVAIHCGGWGKIDGGQCTHAWRLLTGCKEQYTFRDDGDGFGCYGSFNPNTQKWEELGNSPSDGFQGLWPMAWPEAGGGGELELKLNRDELFLRMCKWDDDNYVMAVGTKAGSDTNVADGIVDGHAYTVMQCIDNAGGTEFHMIKVRNPWGRGEFTSGIWDDDGPGWEQYPSVREACHPVNADDGIFWIDAEGFFGHFKTVYLCAHDMHEFLK